MKQILSIFSILITISAFSQPANDDCSNAISLTLQSLSSPVYTTGNLGDATESTPACSGTVSTDVWYSFTANSEGNYIQIPAPAQTNIDLAFELYGDCGTTSIACVDNNSTGQNEGYYNNKFVIGQTYYIKVFAYNQSFSNAAFEIAVIDIPADANDECVNAISLPLQNLSSPTYTDGNLGGATESTPACSGSTSTDLWYSFVANSQGNYIYLPPQTNLDLAFELYSDCGTTNIACVDNNSANFSEGYYNNNFIIGHTYYVKVFLKNQKSYNLPFQIAVMDIPAPVNDECVNAVEIPVQDENSPAYITGNIGGATESLPACSGNSATDVWFYFTANSTKAKIFIDATYSFDPAFEIFDACGGNSIVCVDNNTTSESEAYYSANFVQGNNYYIRVFGYQQLAYELEFNITVIDSSISTSLNNISNYTEINLYPNPASDKLIIETGDESYSNIQVLSITGAILIKQRLYNRNDIDISELKQGIYFVKLYSKKNNNQMIKRLIIER